MNGYIYKITNLLNGKIYIGQTRQSIQTRWEQHCSSSYVCHFHQAIQKYGRNNFQVEEICCVDLPEKELEQKLNALEIEYIKKFDSYTNGYNSTLGGSGNFKCRYEEIYEIWIKEKISISKISEKYGYNQSTIRKALMANGISQEQINQRGIQISAEAKMVYDWSKIISDYQADMPIKDIIIKYKISHEALLYRALERNGVPLRGQSKHIVPNRSKAINQYDLQGNFLATYQSAAEAARATKGSAGKIAATARGVQKTSGGFKWRWCNEEN